MSHDLSKLIAEAQTYRDLVRKLDEPIANYIDFLLDEARRTGQLETSLLTSAVMEAQGRVVEALDLNGEGAQ